MASLTNGLVSGQREWVMLLWKVNLWHSVFAQILYPLDTITVKQYGKLQSKNQDFHFTVHSYWTVLVKNKTSNIKQRANNSRTKSTLSQFGQFSCFCSFYFCFFCIWTKTGYHTYSLIHNYHHFPPWPHPAELTATPIIRLTVPQRSFGGSSSFRTSLRTSRQPPKRTTSSRTARYID